ncbi:hypothetical protein RRG08_040139 [Elysia crispata]|uniref:Uncharacterized protein n=1 Tax=Elysia crispata TaxID=231223 RepID=A0AAE0XXG7_9GAST|nr:hypothetical protein RRG08_040139 [Elysia crispata]
MEKRGDTCSSAFCLKLKSSTKGCHKITPEQRLETFEKLWKMSTWDERKLNRDIFTPRNYALLMETAKQSPSPYHVGEVVFSDAKKMSSDYVKSIRPGKRVGHATVSDVCS